MACCETVGSLVKPGVQLLHEVADEVGEANTDEAERGGPGVDIYGKNSGELSGRLAMAADLVYYTAMGEV